MQEAEANLEACIAEKSESHPDCKAARVTYLERQRRYEEISRTAWGCDPAIEECPTPR